MNNSWKWRNIAFAALLFVLIVIFAFMDGASVGADMAARDNRADAQE